MVAFTPNRAYPYSTPTDPADVPAAIQALAESIDVDMQLLDDSIVQRPFAVVSARSATSQVFPADQVTECEFDFVDFDNAGISNLSTQPTRLRPTSAGLWAVWASFADPTSQAALHDLNLRVNGGDLVRASTNNNTIGEPFQAITAVGMAFMDGATDYFTVTYQPLGGLSDFRTKQREFACWRLTNT